MICTSITRSKQLLGVPGLLFDPRILTFALFLFLITTLVLYAAPHTFSILQRHELPDLAECQLVFGDTCYQ